MVPSTVVMRVALWVVMKVDKLVVMMVVPSAHNLAVQLVAQTVSLTDWMLVDRMVS
jgi:hypothetical protein